MGCDSIKINFASLDYAVCAMNELESTLNGFLSSPGSGSHTILSTSSLVNSSEGAASSSLNAAYGQLLDLEASLLGLVTNTKAFLTAAGISFEQADETSSQILSEIGGSLHGEYTYNVGRGHTRTASDIYEGVYSEGE
ncbi:MAG: hypothetical protein LBS58_03965 [Coriobacteriales bacterium]|jgi:hypothetical protein|nr:hypothetical protein [Coriobacteriales bacterium]